MDIQKIARNISDLLGDAKRPVHLHEPDLAGKELDYVTECIKTGWVSSAGSYVDRFGKELGEFCGGFAVPTVNGTAALHLSLVLADIQAGEEVIVPALTFVATANAVSYCGAVPHFADVHPDNFGLDAKKLDDYLSKLLENGVNKNTGRKISTMIATHIFGHCAEIETLMEVAAKHGLILIEDAAESLGSYYKGRHTGLFGQVSALSFNGNKILTTGGGGAVLTKDRVLADKAKHLSTTAKLADPYMHIHDAVGYNYRMPNINAALGCAQLEKLPEYLGQKKILASVYESFFAGLYGVDFVKEPANTTSNNWLNSVVMDSKSNKDALIDALAEKEIYCRGIWQIMPDLPMYQDMPCMDVSVARDLAERTLNLPSSPTLALAVKL